MAQQIPVLTGLLKEFLFGFGTLFAIINPYGLSFVFLDHTKSVSDAERRALAKRVAISAFGVLVVSLFAGTAILRFFGVSLPALRIGGGLVVAASGWEMLHEKLPSEGQAKRHPAFTPGFEAYGHFPAHHSADDRPRHHCNGDRVVGQPAYDHAGRATALAGITCRRDRCLADDPERVQLFWQHGSLVWTGGHVYRDAHVCVPAGLRWCSDHADRDTGRHPATPAGNWMTVTRQGTPMAQDRLKSV